MLQMPSRRPQVLPMQASQEGDQREEEDDKPLQEDLQYLHQVQLQQQDQEKPLQAQEEEQWQSGCTHGWEEGSGVEPTYSGAKEVITNMKGPQSVWVPKKT